MNMLPDNARDRHRTHKAHDNNALAFHQEENAERITSNVKDRTKKIPHWAFGVGALERLTFEIASRLRWDFRRPRYFVRCLCCRRSPRPPPHLHGAVRLVRSRLRS